MKRSKVVLLTALSALAISAIAASGAQADAYGCALTGAAGPVTAYPGGTAAPDSETGVESILYDLTVESGTDGPLGLPLLDTDQNNGRAEGGGEDGSYGFTTVGNTGLVVCLYVPTGADDPRVNEQPGIYEADIVSEGEYDNVVCGTGWAVDDTESTTLDTVAPIVNPLGGTMARIDDVDYRIDFVAGQGVLVIRSALNTGSGENGQGAGVISIRPTVSDPDGSGLPNEPCVTGHVRGFAVSGAFAGVG